MTATEKSPLLFSLGHETATDAYMVLTRGEIRVEGPDDLRQLRDALLVYIENDQAEAEQKGRAFNRLYHFTTRAAGGKIVQGLAGQAGILTLTVHASLADLSTWEINGNTTTRTVYRTTGDREVKTWSRYYAAGIMSWEVTFNTHPRKPRHLRSGKLPQVGNLLYDELVSQLQANPNPGPELSALIHALNLWSVEAHLSESDLEAIYAQMPVLETIHRLTKFEDQARVVPTLMDALTTVGREGTPALTDLYRNYLQEVEHNVRFKQLIRDLARG